MHRSDSESIREHFNLVSVPTAGQEHSTQMITLINVTGDYYAGEMGLNQLLVNFMGGFHWFLLTF